MLIVTVAVGGELFDTGAQEFIQPKNFKLVLEHSLVSLSKWESFYEKPFINSDKTAEETLHYIRDMTITPEVPEEVYASLSQSNIDKITAYIEAKMTATTIHQLTSNANLETVTSELIYYWMIALGIPFECQHWHLSRLLMLVKVCNIKNAPPKKMSKAEIAAHNRALNDERRKKYGTKG